MINDNYKELKIWQKSVEMTVRVHESTQKFPKDEVLQIMAQLRRSGTTIPSNIAQGFRCRSMRELSHCLSLSHGASYELYTRLAIANEIGFPDESLCYDLEADNDEIQKMNRSLKKSLRL